MTIGQITFGPTRTATEIARWQAVHSQMQSYAPESASVQACNCMGPQGGETKCPCALNAEMTKASQMIRDGVTIGGKKYRLVPVEG